MATHGRLYITTALLLAVASSDVVAQSMTVIGGDSFANECYMSATIAVQMNSAGRDDLKDCNLALQHSQLSLRDRMATYVNRGIVYAAMEEYNKAIKDYATAIRMNPDVGEAYVNRGNLYFLGALFDRAVQEYTTALNIGMKKEHVAYYNRGMAYENLKDYSKAEADYRHAISLLPEWTDPHTKLERVLAKLEKESAPPQ